MIRFKTGLLHIKTFQFRQKSITWLVITFQDLFALLRDFCWHMQKRENLKATSLAIEALKLPLINDLIIQRKSSKKGF